MVVVGGPRTSSNAAPSWKYGLCDCLSECGLSCAACCCMPNVLGQLRQRMVAARPGQRVCWGVAATAWVLLLSTHVFSTTSQQLSDAAHRTEYMWFGVVETVDRGVLAIAVVVGALASLCGIGNVIYTTYYLTTSRAHLRQKGGIPAGDCGSCDDCCVSYWCACCSAVQMLREHGIDSSSYRLCSQDGEQRQQGALAV